MIIRRIIGLAISAAILGIGYHVYSQHQTPYTDTVKTQLQNHYGQ